MLLIRSAVRAHAGVRCGSFQWGNQMTMGSNSARTRPRRRVRAAAVAAVVVGGAVLIGDPASAAANGALTPYLNCVTTDAQTGDVTAYFGYDNTLGSAEDFAVGDDNQTFPVDAFQGQPTYFNQGDYAQVFPVTFDPQVFQTVSWVLDGQLATASASSRACVSGVTAPAEGLTPDRAVLTGVVVPGGAAGGYSFAYGASRALGSTTPVQDTAAGTQPELVQAAVGGLAPSTTYYYRIDASSGSVTTQGQILSFTTPAAAPLAVSTRELAEATVGTAYTARLAGSGGVAPYVWSVVRGALPVGLTLNPATGAITGKPRAAGNASFTVRLASPGLPGLKAATSSLHIEVRRAQPVH
jgi:Putative Ig domain